MYHFSFAVNLGIQFRFIPIGDWSINNPPPRDRLKNQHCHLRGKLTKSLHQPQLGRNFVWYIDAGGSNLLFVLADVRESFTQRGLPWFARFAALRDVLRCLREEEMSEEWFGPGALDSPNRRWHTGHVARALGEDRLADQLIADAEAELELIRVQISQVRKRRHRS